MSPHDDRQIRPASTPGSRSRVALELVLLTLAVLWLGSQFGQRAPAPPREVPPKEFSAQRVVRWLGGLQALRPRPGGTEPHAEFRRSLVDALEDLGLEVEVQETLARGPSGRIAVVRNVVARQFAPAQSKAILLAAHYDSVGCSPGAADDGAGCASLLEIARALAQGEALGRPVVYLFSDAEEAGLIGAEAFASQHRWAPEVGCVVNLEARGSSGPSVMFRSRGGLSAIEALARIGRVGYASSLADFIFKLMPNDTDYSVFAARGTPGFDFAFLGGLWSYHTPRDDLERLDPGSVQQQGAQVLALTRELARVPIESWSDESVTFTDVLGLRIVAWRPWFGALLAAAATFFALRRARSGMGSTLRSIALVGASVVAAAAVSLGVVWSAFEILAARIVSADAGARDPFTSGACVVWLSAGAFFFVAAVCARRASFREAWCVLGIAASAAALVLSLALHEASHLALAPCLGWCALEAGLAPERDATKSQRVRVASALVGMACLALTLWTPIAAQFELALSFRMPVALAIPVVATLALSWPTITLVRARLLALCGGLMFVLAALGLTLVSFKIPGGVRGIEWLNLRYLYDAEHDSARYEASTFGARLQSLVADAANWSPATTPAFEWLSLDRSMHVAPAPRFEGPAPRIEVLDSQPIDGGRRLRCRLVSPRGAPRLHLHLPETVDLEAVAWRGRTIDSGFEGVRTQLFFAIESDGVEAVLFDRAATPSHAHLLDQDWAHSADHEALLSQRDEYYAVPRSDGDVVIVGARCALE